jgi:hypothetical protein
MAGGRVGPVPHISEVRTKDPFVDDIRFTYVNFFFSYQVYMCNCFFISTVHV